MTSTSVGASGPPPEAELHRETSAPAVGSPTGGPTRLTAGQFRRHLSSQHIPVKYVATLDTGEFQVYLPAGIAPRQFQALLEGIEALPEVRSAQRPSIGRGADVLFVTPSWLPMGQIEGSP
ncbi:hypothetical protein GCM10022223_18910 [Kineosporia mesophila]|uniref:Uncharacterized protein n=1 Tax=Kineosporia mesophila TaxID=566012 RepID=A0ABP6ZAM4_9ACTN